MGTEPLCVGRGGGGWLLGPETVMILTNSYVLRKSARENGADNECFGFSVQ